MNKTSMWLLASVIGILSAASGPAVAGEENEVKIKFADVPAAVQKTLQQESGGAKIEEVTKETEDGKTTYEVEVKINGKNYDIEVAEDGMLLEKKLEDDEEEEVEIKFSETPAAVQKTLKREAGGAVIEKVKKETEEGKTTFEAEVKIDGRIYEIEVAADGILQEKKVKDEEEVAIKLADCPVAVQKTLKREAGGVAIDKVDRESRGGRVIFEIDVKIDGKDYEILVAEDGLLISKALDEEDEDEQDRGTGGKEKKSEKDEDDDD